MKTHASRDITRRYVDAVNAKDLEPLRTLLADDVVATVGDGKFGKEEWIAALSSLLPALEHYEVHELMADGERAVVVYDFVSPAATVPCVEVLTVTHDEIRDIQLIFERLHWDEVLAVARAATAG